MNKQERLDYIEYLTRLLDKYYYDAGKVKKIGEIICSYYKHGENNEH